ncbi:MAG: hypothetical protein E6Q36_02850 [Chryseobacterium sp.]|nr:MAG: hypothetical protein E6Q36_02850 [Chryseobacterium sp.]
MKSNNYNNFVRDKFIESLLTEQEAEMILKMMDSPMEDDKLLATVLFKEKLVKGIRKYLRLLPPVFTEEFVKDVRKSSIIVDIPDLKSALEYIGIFTAGSKLKRLKEDYERVTSNGYKRRKER